VAESNFDLDWRHKGYWLPDGPVGAGDLIGTSILDGPFTWPLLVAKDSALRYNIAAMATYFAERDVRHAPHGKTTMAPSLFAAQLEAGAWGLTAATANQVLVYERFGVSRILLASQVLDARPLAWLAARERPEVLSYVDSAEGVRAMAAIPGDRPFRILVELGFAGGRTGCRTVAELVEVARAARSTGRVEVVGVAGYEGILPDVAAVRSFLGRVREAAGAVGDLMAATPIVSAGGSAYVDVVIDELRDAGDLIVRSGAYVAHDDGHYAGSSRLAARLRPALEVWAQVLSTPEPGLAIVGMGKRDVPHDLGLPVPLDRDGAVTALDDHHAYVRATGLRPGEVVRFGISHPCTAFDRWRVIPVVDDDHRIVDHLHTYF
jgi:D-serine deaminase-like pyridoxal phosphate-dependent protein